MSQSVCVCVCVCVCVSGMDGVEFVCGRAEDVLQRYLEEEGGREEGTGEIIAIVDPPRAGLRTSVCRGMTSNAKTYPKFLQLFPSLF